MDSKAGMYAKLFYYYPALRASEFVSAGKIDEENMVRLPFVHASDYILILSADPMGALDTPGNPL